MLVFGVTGALLVAGSMMQKQADGDAAIKHFTKESVRIADAKTTAINSFLDAKGLRFEGDTQYNVKERLDLLTGYGKITTLQERVQIEHTLNIYEKQADDEMASLFSRTTTQVMAIVPYLPGTGGGFGLIIFGLISAAAFYDGRPPREIKQ